MPGRQSIKQSNRPTIYFDFSFVHFHLALAGEQLPAFLADASLRVSQLLLRRVIDLCCVECRQSTPDLGEQRVLWAERDARQRDQVDLRLLVAQQALQLQFQ